MSVFSLLLRHPSTHGSFSEEGRQMQPRLGIPRWIKERMASRRPGSRVSSVCSYSLLVEMGDVSLSLTTAVGEAALSGLLVGSLGGVGTEACHLVEKTTIGNLPGPKGKGRSLCGRVKEALAWRRIGRAIALGMRRHCELKSLEDHMIAGRQPIIAVRRLCFI